MASHSGSRKRLKVSRTDEPHTTTNMSSVASSSITANTMAAAPEKASLPTPGAHEAALKALNTDVEAMRQLVTCKICDRLLYEPYSLSCGHTYCYSCLSQWLVSNRKKTCPDCRARISQQPTPSYIVRELVLIFVSRSELLPDGETSEEHHTLAQQEGKIVTADRANTDPSTGGLFKGCFSGRRARLVPLHDQADGVDRCPHCHWELEDGVCEQCGYVDDDFLDVTDEDDDLSDDISDAHAVLGIDGEDDFLGGDDFDVDNSSLIDGENGQAQGPEDAAYRGMQADQRHRQLRRQLARRRVMRRLNDMSSDEDEDSEDEENDPTMQGFIDDGRMPHDVWPNSDEDTDVPEVVRSRRIGRRRAPIVVPDDDEEEDSNVPSTAGTEASFLTARDGASDDEQPVVRGSQGGQRGRVPIRPRRGITVSDSDGHGSSGSDEDDSSNDDNGDHESSVAGYGGFSPVDRSVADDFSQRSEYDSDHGSSMHAMDGTDEHEDGSSESDGEDDGWGSLFPAGLNSGTELTRTTDSRSETPRAAHQPEATHSHRLGNGGQRSNRYMQPQNNYPPYPGQHPYQHPYHHPYTPGPTVYGPPHAYPNYHPPPPPPGMYGALPPYGTARPPAHPFQLGNTLNGINYNQRHQQVRSRPNPRAVSAPSSRSSNGGVGVQSSRSSGNSGTVRAGAGRRKRALSISSDVSYE